MKLWNRPNTKNNTQSCEHYSHVICINSNWVATGVNYAELDVKIYNFFVIFYGEWIKFYMYNILLNEKKKYLTCIVCYVNMQKYELRFYFNNEKSQER